MIRRALDESTGRGGNRTRTDLTVPGILRKAKGFAFSEKCDTSRRF
jgi:hypothetical protein